MSTDHRRDIVGRSRGGADHPNRVSVTAGGPVERYRTTVWCPQGDQRPARPDRSVRLRDGTRGMLRALHASSARAKNDLLGQMRRPPAIDPRVPDLFQRARHRGARPFADGAASNGQTGGPLRRHQLPAVGVRSVNCWAWLWHGAGTSLVRIASELGRHRPHTDLWEITVNAPEGSASRSQSLDSRVALPTPCVEILVVRVVGDSYPYPKRSCARANSERWER
jgi:hypothetical protein